MSIYLNKDSKVIVQGITGGEGTKHTALMLKAGTNVVGGVNARKAGTTVLHTAQDGSAVELPVFGSVAEAIEKTVRWYAENAWWWRPIKSGALYQAYYAQQYGKRLSEKAERR